MKTLLVSVLGLLVAQAAMAQEKGEFEIGVGGASYLRSGASRGVIEFNYFNPTSGVFLPVKINLGKEFRQYTAGIGYAGYLHEDVRGAVSAALPHALNSNCELEEFDRNRFAFLLQSELSFQLSQRFSLATTLTIDPFNFSRTDQRANEETNYVRDDMYNYTAEKTENYDKAVKSSQFSSLANLGLTLRINLSK